MAAYGVDYQDGWITLDPSISGTVPMVLNTFLVKY